MVVKSAIIAQTPFDINYNNVPDLIEYTGQRIKSELVRYLMLYTNYEVLNVETNFRKGYSVPCNRDITFYFTTELEDAEINRYNYIILMSHVGQNPATWEGGEFYFIKSMEISNTAVQKSVVLHCTRDLWVTYFKDIMHAPPQNIARSHENPFLADGTIDKNFYTEDSIDTFTYNQQDFLNGEYSILYLKILLDPNAICRIQEDNTYTYVDKGEITNGTFKEVAVPYALYNRFSGVYEPMYDNDSIKYIVRGDLNLPPKKLEKYSPGFINLGYPQIVGAYFTFAHLTNFEFNYMNLSSTATRRAIINFTDDIVKGDLYIKVGENFVNTQIYCIAGYSHIERKYKHEFSRTYYFTANDIDITNFESFVPEYHITKQIPKLKVGGKEIVLYGEGEMYLSLIEKDNQNGIVCDTSLMVGDDVYLRGEMNKIIATQSGYVAKATDQYTQYMTANTNHHNFAVLNSAVSYISSSARYANLGSAVATGNLGGSPLMGTDDVVRSASAWMYEASGKMKDLKNSVSSLSTDTASGISELYYLDRPVIYIDVVKMTAEYRSYLYNCLIYGTNRSKVGYIKDNVRPRYDYIALKNVQITTIGNFNDLEDIKRILIRGVRKVHLDGFTSNYIDLFVKNVPTIR